VQTPFGKFIEHFAHNIPMAAGKMPALPKQHTDEAKLERSDGKRQMKTQTSVP
jgi:hypothetical protein